jgi:hypothetical protein
VLCCAVVQTVTENLKDQNAFTFIVKDIKKFYVILLLKKKRKKRGKNIITSQKMSCS